MFSGQKASVYVIAALLCCTGCEPQDAAPADAGVAIDGLCDPSKPCISTQATISGGGCPCSGGGGGGQMAPTCTASGCTFAPWGWCGVGDSPSCMWGGAYSSTPSEMACEQGALATCANIGYPIAECWIAMAADCSTADSLAAYRHCLVINELPPGSTCHLAWR